MKVSVLHEQAVRVTRPGHDLGDQRHDAQQRQARPVQPVPAPGIVQRKGQISHRRGRNRHKHKV